MKYVSRSFILRYMQQDEVLYHI
ncbi:unnamed protein product [Spirodela intermedia]|uniref:Uncharacterized protein n=1 Tax=Spirodela intermedia TaxID=51605 RepID=A0A7I8K3B1_SPIIN|nr:unnamed protein product [Spirodela intermedia]